MHDFFAPLDNKRLHSINNQIESTLVAFKDPVQEAKLAKAFVLEHSKAAGAILRTHLVSLAADQLLLNNA